MGKGWRFFFALYFKKMTLPTKNDFWPFWASFDIKKSNQLNLEMIFYDPIQ